MRDYHAAYGELSVPELVRDVLHGSLVEGINAAIECCDRWATEEPLFTAFGAAATASRVTSAGGSKARLIVTDEANRAKLDGLENCPPVLLVDRGRTTPGEFAAALAAQMPEFPTVTLRGNDPFVLLFTSGTTGKSQRRALAFAFVATKRSLYARRGRSAA